MITWILTEVGRVLPILCVRLDYGVGVVCRGGCDEVKLGQLHVVRYDHLVLYTPSVDHVYSSVPNWKTNTLLKKHSHKIGTREDSSLQKTIYSDSSLKWLANDTMSTI